MVEIILAIIALCVISYLFFYFLIKKVTSKIFNYKLERLPTIISSCLLTIGLFLFIISKNEFGMKAEAARNYSGADYSLEGLKGKIVIIVPDSIRVLQKGRVIVRIAEHNFKNDIFIEKTTYHDGNFIIDSLKLSTVMSVNLRESSSEDKIIIKRLNNDSIQVIDTTRYSQWTFDIMPKKWGKTNLVVSASSFVKTDFGNHPVSSPVFEKEIQIYAIKGDKVIVLWKNNPWLLLIFGTCIFLILLKLIPKQVIIDIYTMENSNKTNFWNAGSLGLFIYIITIVSIVIFKIMNISSYYAILVFAATVLIYAVFTAVSLRDSGKISEDNFLKLMEMSIKKIPPLNFIFKK